MPRIALAAGMLPDALRPFVWSDVLFIWERGVRDGQIPYRDAFFEYPPLIGYAWAGIAAFATSPAAHVAAWAAVQAVAAGIVAYVLGREAGPRPTTLFWSLSPQLFLYGSMNFETLALAPLVVAVALARRDRVVLSSIGLGLGTVVKLFPAVALPVVLARARDVRSAATAGAAFLIVVAAAFAPGATAAYSTLGTIARYGVGIDANIDSAWGLFGRAVDAMTGFDPAPAIVATSLVGMAVTYALLVAPAARRAADPAVTIGLGLAAVLLWNRLYSPQYALWILPFFALAGLGRRAFAILRAADVAVFLTVYPLTLVERDPADPMRALLLGGMAAAVALRLTALLLVTRELWLRARGPNAQ